MVKPSYDDLVSLLQYLIYKTQDGQYYTACHGDTELDGEWEKSILDKLPWPS